MQREKLKKPVSAKGASRGKPLSPATLHGYEYSLVGYERVNRLYGCESQPTRMAEVLRLIPGGRKVEQPPQPTA